MATRYIYLLIVWLTLVNQCIEGSPTPTRKILAASPPACKRTITVIGKQCGGLSKKLGLNTNKTWPGFCCSRGLICRRQAPTLWTCQHKSIKTENPGQTSVGQQTNLGQYNYSSALSASFLFYEAQRSGKLPRSNRIKWRGDTLTDVRDKNGRVIQGGWFDAGDNIRFNFPGAWTVSVLAWGILEFPSGYAASGQLPYALDNLRWGADFMLRSLIDSKTIVAQIGLGSVDHAIWNRPEAISVEYKPLYVTDKKPGSDLAGAMTAALSATALVFKTSDPVYAAKCLQAAKTMYKFGTTHLGKYTDSLPDKDYLSRSMYDDLSYGSIWLYKATQDVVYKQDAIKWLDLNQQKEGAPWPPYGWGNQTFASSLLIAKATKDPKYIKITQGFFHSVLKGTGRVRYTPKGLVWLHEWGSLRHAANAAFLAAVYARSGLATVEQAQLLTCFTYKQMGYILGDAGHSFVVGWGKNPPCRPHHRGASCLRAPAQCSWEDFKAPGCNPQTLTGAIVGGPDVKDHFTDSRATWKSNEVGVDYNAAFTGALAALVRPLFSRGMCVTKGYTRFPTTKTVF